MTAVTINEMAYRATNPMARTARIVNAVMSLLDRARPEGGASVDAFPGAVSVVFEDIKTLLWSEMTLTLSFPLCGHAPSASPTRRALSVEDRHPRQGPTRLRRSGRHPGHRWPSGLPGRCGRGRSAPRTRLLNERPPPRTPPPSGV